MVASREELKDYCLRELGAPVIDINVDDDQLEDRIDEALAYFKEFHFDGLEMTYVKYLVTQTDIDNRYIPITNDLVLGIQRILMLPTSNPLSMWNVKYQIFLNDVYNYTSPSFTGYYLARRHMREIEFLFANETPIKYNRLSSRLNLELEWGVDLKAGDYIVMYSYVAIDDTLNTKIWNDWWLKQYTVALFKRQWGANTKKFSNVQLLGGTVLNGKEIYDEAIAEIKEIREQMMETPLDFLVG